VVVVVDAVEGSKEVIQEYVKMREQLKRNFNLPK
jgi:hypothetical protein